MRRLFFALLVVGLPLALQAQPKENSLNAKQIVEKSTQVIHYLKNKLTTISHEYTKALNHQRYATQLFVRGNHSGAIQHSLCARTIAFEAFTANQLTIPDELLILESEWEASPNQPSNATLYQELETNFAAVMYREDDAAMSDDLTDLKLPE